jgi:hypothetical protein
MEIWATFIGQAIHKIPQRLVTKHIVEKLESINFGLFGKDELTLVDSYFLTSFFTGLQLLVI